LPPVGFPQETNVGLPLVATLPDVTFRDLIVDSPPPHQRRPQRSQGSRQTGACLLLRPEFPTGRLHMQLDGRQILDSLPNRNTQPSVQCRQQGPRRDGACDIGGRPVLGADRASNDADVSSIPPRIVIGDLAHQTQSGAEPCLSFLVLECHSLECCSRRRPQLDTLRHLTGRDQTPQRYQQLARQCQAAMR
jgi:hypothetical protein